MLVFKMSKPGVSQDPFGAMRHLKGSTPGTRCEEAVEDKGHYPYKLSMLIMRVNQHVNITVLPVLIQGGPYFENGESRRRARYAVVTALLNAGWEPYDEDKIGYVWTFENCVENVGARRIPAAPALRRVRPGHEATVGPIGCLDAWAAPGSSSSGWMRTRCRELP